MALGLGLFTLLLLQQGAEAQTFQESLGETDEGRKLAFMREYEGNGYNKS